MIKAIAIDDEPLALNVITSLCETHNGIALEKTFSKPLEAQKYLNKFPVDLVFLDINMPAISGMHLAKSIKQDTMVIFTTAHSEYAVESYDVRALDYLLKPISPNRFEQAINKAIKYYNNVKPLSAAESKTLFIRADFSLIQISIQDILLIEGMADYVKIHIKDRKSVVARMTMKEITAKLPENDFIRINRSSIIPCNRIETVRNKTVIISDREIPIGNTYIDDFFKRFPKE
jgi:DNA-binding LytR/AlgR family response regulator